MKFEELTEENLLNFEEEIKVFLVFAIGFAIVGFGVSILLLFKLLEFW